jgi:hypothetical protein
VAIDGGEVELIEKKLSKQAVINKLRKEKMLKW